MSSTPPSTATIHAPPWLWGANPAHFFETAGLHARMHDVGKGTWQVKTGERHTRVSESGCDVDTSGWPGCVVIEPAG
jgi:hypothetical protein